MMKIKVLCPLFVLFFVKAPAQSEGLTSSPYSLYGLGVINQVTLGEANGLGYTGIGSKSRSSMNGLNPAAYSLIPKNTFFYDIGIRSEHNAYSNTSDSEDKTNLNFSNLAFAFPITSNLGLGISIIPYSDVGYSLVGIESNIEGASEIFKSNITGLGGLSDLKVNLGYQIVDNIRVGTSLSLLFGNISEEENFVISTSSFQQTKKTNYSGIKLGLGFQFDLTDNLTIGNTINFPTRLNGSSKQSIFKQLDNQDITVELEEQYKVEDFKLPLELGMGISTKLWNQLTVNLDYKKNFWSSTDQKEHIGEYQDQDIYGLGMQYLNNRNGFKYWQRIRFRAGFNYDNGYLSINDRKIDGYGITFGLGLPINKRKNSLINLSYSYGSKGQIQNILIKENYHRLTLNLSLEDFWFGKRKID